MRGIFNLVRNDKILYRFFSLSIGVIGLTGAYALIFYRSLPPVIPLYNQLTWGEQRLSPSWGIFIPDLMVLAIFLVNLLLSGFVYTKTPLVSRMLAVTSFLISILTFLFIFRTIQIVI